MQVPGSVLPQQSMGRVMLTGGIRETACDWHGSLCTSFGVPLRDSSPDRSDAFLLAACRQIPALLCAGDPPEGVQEIVDEGEDDGNDHETEDS